MRIYVQMFYVWNRPVRVRPTWRCRKRLSTAHHQRSQHVEVPLLPSLSATQEVHLYFICVSVSVSYIYVSISLLYLCVCASLSYVPRFQRRGFTTSETYVCVPASLLHLYRMSAASLRVSRGTCHEVCQEEHCHVMIERCVHARMHARTNMHDAHTRMHDTYMHATHDTHMHATQDDTHMHATQHQMQVCKC